MLQLLSKRFYYSTLKKPAIMSNIKTLRECAEKHQSRRGLAQARLTYYGPGQKIPYPLNGAKTSVHPKTSFSHRPWKNIFKIFDPSLNLSLTNRQ